ncbi:MAG: division/cell wall cluster transcriptional repressor MraZ [Bacteroidetes bacterium]|nr:MAG: division/cell wall cluster transcriptional repressor MraZ [Bacteroidota bacterium]
MAFFKGKEIHSVDSKGRVNLPAKMRKIVSPDANDNFTVIRGLDKCIEVYPSDIWKLKEARFEELDQYEPESRYFLRKLLMWSEEVDLDGQQRIILPKKLMEYAEIDNKVVIIGVGDHIEIWNPEVFDKYIEGSGESFEAIAAKVMSGRQ